MEENKPVVQPTLKVRTSESLDKIIPALLKAAENIHHAEKDAQNTHTKNSYATIASVIEATKKPLLDNKILLIQLPTSKSLTTRLQHDSGQFYEVEMDLLLPKADMQGLGSAITYARRYSITSMLNMSQVDDDGLDASRPGKVQRPVKPAPTPAKETPTAKPKADDNF